MPPISVTIFASDPGIYFLEDVDGIPGNNYSRVRFPDGTTVAFEHPTNDLIFDPNVPGVIVTVNFTDSLGAADLRIGDLTDPAASPSGIKVGTVQTTGTVTLVSNGPIKENGADAAADIVAGALILSAVSGIGENGANPLETRVAAVEAETTTDGIAITNLGTVSIGGLSLDQVDGLDVVTSGDLTFANFGRWCLRRERPRNRSRRHTSGNVVLTAAGVDTDVIANVDQDSISAPRGISR